MAISYDSSNDTLRVSVTDLVAGTPFSRAAGGRGNRLQLGQATHVAHADQRAANHPGYRPEVPVSVELEIDGATVTLRGRVDGSWPTPAGPVLEEVKLLPRYPAELPLPGDLTQLRAYLWIWQQLPDESRPSTGLLSYIDPWRQRTRSHDIPWTDELAVEVGGRVRDRLGVILRHERAEVARLARRAAEATAIRWPFPDRREGQTEMAEAVREAIVARRHLCLEAPTGSGKTAPIVMAALNEAVRRRARLFIATSRTSQQGDRLELLTALAPASARGRVLLLGSRERLGDTRWVEDAPADGDASSDDTASALPTPWCDPYDPPAWLLALWDRGEPATPDQVRELAREHAVPAGSLQWQLASMADVLVGDLNYLIRPRGLPPAWLLPSRGKRAVIGLVDEAHNLPERIRDMAAGQLSLDGIARLADLVEFHGGTSRDELLATLDRLARHLDELVREGGEEGGPALRLLEPDDPALLEPMRRLLDQITGLGEGSMTSAHREIVQQLRAAVVLAGQPSIGACYLDRANGTAHWELMNTGAPLAPIWDGMRSAVLFSATLTPFGLLLPEVGLVRGRTDTVSLTPAADPGVQRIVRYTGISTTWRGRQESMPDLAHLLVQCAESSDRPWLVFFPSRAYLEQARVLLSGHDVRCTPLTPGLTPAMLRFLDREEGPRLHLTVLGGAYAEGFDPDPGFYSGAVIVSLGLAPPNPRSELQRLYTETDLETQVAPSLIPALRRVRQAAGRLFRSPDHPATLVLVDERWAGSELVELLPGGWSQSPEAATPEELQPLLERL